MKSTLFYSYLAIGLSVCIAFAAAAKAGWRLPSAAVSSGAAGWGTRSYGGSWGGGK